ncbi:MAG TPA: archaemetzincin family Zn-dependent metalloprotease [Methanomicrobiales archaeon]|jgi:archaemetzincin|nr:archaemetzincin family Zn-dependent metalloprotease [Methanomicrobiales archaeon]
MNPALRIALFPVGDVDPVIISRLREDLQGIFDTLVHPCAAMPLGGRHFVKGRGQHLADGLLEEFSAIVSGEGTILLGVTAADLFSPGLSFVFGIANRGRALISVFRLHPEFYGREPNAMVFRRRVLVEAVHELGHALGLSHCDYPGCVMYFSNWIGDTDRKGPGFCFRCARSLERLVETGGA